MITFYTRALGSSHIASNKPCQDSGKCYHKDGVSIVIVCDGHGGDSYVRSDVGSQFAADIACAKILDFINNTPKDILANKKGAITAIPTSDPRFGTDGKKRDVSTLSESELDLLRQNIQYITVAQSVPEIEKLFRTLFMSIVETWRIAINENLRKYPFSTKEKELIGSKRIEKAYGTTLMAAVRTPDYWFAFHIGDGKLLACNNLMQWYEPVPWDCNCFLNLTTSLCDYSPVEEFRYAFDGTGDFPLAFALGSDGIDDSFIKPELIHKFYSNILQVFSERDIEEATALLTSSLSNLSKRGSHDDMSVAAIIDTAHLPMALEYYNIISEVRSLSAEREKRKESIDAEQRRIRQMQERLVQKTAIRDEEAKSAWEWWKQVCKKRIKQKLVYDSLSKEVSEIKEDIQRHKAQCTKLENQLNDWIKIHTEHVGELRKQANELELIICSNSEKNETTYQMTTSNPESCKNQNKEDKPKDVYEKASNARMSEEKIAEMDKESDEQARAILNNENIDKEIIF